MAKSTPGAFDRDRDHDRGSNDGNDSNDSGDGGNDN